MKLSIIIPAYNEENRILKTLEEYHSFFTKKLNSQFELIITLNNCKDNTCKIVTDFKSNRGNIIVHTIPNYSGKGGAVIKGFELAIGDLIGFVDADNSIDPENYYKLYLNIKDAKGIIASRKIKGAVIGPKRRFYQDISSHLFNMIVRFLFNFNYRDTQCGAKIFRKDVAKMLSEKCTEKGWAFDVDFLYLCKKDNLDVIEYPIYWKDSEGSKLTLKGRIDSLINVIKYRLRK